MDGPRLRSNFVNSPSPVESWRKLGPTTVGLFFWEGADSVTDIDDVCWWSGIFFVPSHKKFPDPASRFRLLAKHRSGSHKREKTCSSAGLSSFVGDTGLEPVTFPV
jgi:hypothetical protein